MKRRIISLLFLLFLVVMTAAPALAERLPRVMDQALLLSPEETDSLLAIFDDVSERYQLDVVAVTVDSLDGMSAMDYADAFYEQSGYGMGTDRDGILLLLCMSEREWYISTAGRGIDVFDDWTIDEMAEQFLPDFGEGDYLQGFTTYAQCCEKQLAYAEEYGTDTEWIYDDDGAWEDAPDPTPPFRRHLPEMAAGTGIVGILGGFIGVGAKKAKMKSVISARSADAYMDPNSLNITNANELFLYSHINRVPRAESTPNGRSGGGGGSHVHVSSGGMTHGGHGGHF